MQFTSLVIGVFIGSFAGFCVCALLVAGRWADDGAKIKRLQGIVHRLRYGTEN